MNQTILKVIAAISMLFDHTLDFFPEMPIWFEWIGRISAPLFIFCIVIGIKKTSNKRKYIIRLYISCIIMGIVDFFIATQLSLNMSNYNFLRTLTLLAIILTLLNDMKNKEKRHKYLKFVLFLLYQIVISVSLLIIANNLNLNDKYFYLLSSILLPIIELPGGLIFIILGVIFYYTENNKHHITISYIFFCLLYFLVLNTSIPARITNKIYIITNNNELIYTTSSYIFEIFFGIPPYFIKSGILTNPQWMMIFSLPFIILYSGEKGNGLKYLFYIFYPLHLIILLLISLI